MLPTPVQYAYHVIVLWYIMKIRDGSDTYWMKNKIESCAILLPKLDYDVITNMYSRSNISLKLVNLGVNEGI